MKGIFPKISGLIAGVASMLICIVVLAGVFLVSENSGGMTLLGIPLGNTSVKISVSSTSTANPDTSLTGDINCHTFIPPLKDSTQQGYEEIAATDADTYGVDQMTFLWQIQQESGYVNKAPNSAGAEGIAQFEPGTAAGMNPPVDATNVRSSLDGAARLDAGHLRDYAYTAWQIQKQLGGSGKRYQYALALAAYNAGPGAVAKALKWAGPIANWGGPWHWAYAPDWAASWSWDQTFSYMKNILNYKIEEDRCYH